MNVIVTGTRKAMQDEKTWLWFKEALDRLNPTRIIHGDCPNSPDIWGKEYGEMYGVEVEPFPAMWDAPWGFDKDAGKARNTTMAEYGRLLKNTHTVAVWDGKSGGTLDMIKKSVKNGIGVSIVPAKVP